MSTGQGTPSRQSIVELLATRDKAVGRALVALAARQTSDEQSSRQTLHQNARGFNQADGKAGVVDARRFAAYGYLTAAQLAFWRAPQGNGTRISKYASQLLEIALERWAERQLNLEKV